MPLDLADAPRADDLPDHAGQQESALRPQAHLRPFSVDAEGAAINLHLVRVGRAVFRAPVKSQCARPYLYGEDGVLERMLAEVEGRYAGVVRRVLDRDGPLDADDGAILRDFTLLQSHHTAEQIARTLARMEEMASFLRKAEEAHGNPWDSSVEPTRETAMTELMLSVSEQTEEGVLDDLKTVLVSNRTGRDFVTSDDPAVTTNRWLLQRRRVNVFGSNAAGLVLMLPLGPRLLAMSYDPAVYTVSAPSRSGAVELGREADVRAFNDHQYMRAADAIYFRRADEAAAIAAECAATAAHRPPRWDSFTAARRDGGTGTHERFAVGTPDEVARADHIMFHMAREWPTPPSWPSILRYRHDAHGFSRGRRIVRRARMAAEPDTSGWRKVT